MDALTGAQGQVELVERAHTLSPGGLAALKPLMCLVETVLRVRDVHDPLPPRRCGRA